MQHVAQDAAHILEAGLLAPEEAAPTAAADDTTATREDLMAVFTAFASFGLRGDAAAASAIELDSFRCSKLVREAGLLGPGPNRTSLTAQELDVLFASAKDRGVRRCGTGRCNWEGTAHANDCGAPDQHQQATAAD